MEFEEFILGQEGVYSRFRDTAKLESEGIVPNLAGQKGGYLIAYRHPPEITEKLAFISRGVSQIVPSIAYDEKSAHTTISDYLVQDDFSPDRAVLDNICRIVHSCLPISQGVRIDYSDWLANQNTAIAAGIPNRPFFEDSKRIVGYANQNGLPLRMPWGAHITANRFLEVGGQAEVAELLAYLGACKGLGESRPGCVDVGYIVMDPRGVEFVVEERFRI